jgi:hypothetical protein
MRDRHQVRGEDFAESGYALILVMFFLALLVLSLTEAAPTILSRIQREKEAEMIWRGEQYKRGIALYYSRQRHYPTSLEDLMKPDPETGAHFMRQGYKDPMNLVDGSWRLIYVRPNGQLNGSINSVAVLPGSAISSSPAGGSGFTNGFTNSLNSSPFGSNGAAGSTPPGAIGSAFASAAPASDDPGQPHSLSGPMDASNTIGGNIIGVGSKVDKSSFRVFQGKDNYKDFEFISSARRAVGNASVGIGTPAQNMNGTNPPGVTTPNSPFSSGIYPSQNFGQNQVSNPGAGQIPPPPVTSSPN